MRSRLEYSRRPGVGAGVPGLLLVLAAAAAVAAAPAPASCCAAVDASVPPSLSNCGGTRPTGLPFARRSPVLSRKGQVASAHPLASQAGLDILKAGGSAVDAAIATNAYLSFAEPMMNGLGGDLMAIVWSEKDAALVGYNGAGRSAANLSLAEMKAAVAADGAAYIPTLGPLAVTVPGAPRAWCDLSARFGRLPLAAVLAPAIAAAEEGVPVPQIIAEEWAAVPNSTALTSNGAFPRARDGWASVFWPQGRAPREGEIFRNPALASTLRALASGGCDAFYGPGPVSTAILELQASAGIRLSAADLMAHRGEFVTPVSTTYRTNVTVFELPPNPQGAAALEMLNILEGFDLASMGHNSADYLHVHVEAKKLAFADASFYFADPAFADVPLDGIISKSYAATRRALINMTRAAQTDSPGSPPRVALEAIYGGDTTYLAAADGDGNMVSLIQSLYTGFGSGIVSADLGFALQSRGALFSLDETQANVYHAGLCDAQRPAVARFWRHGRLHAAAGARAGGSKPRRLRNECRGGRLGRALRPRRLDAADGAAHGRRRRARTRGRRVRRGRGRAAGARPRRYARP